MPESNRQCTDTVKNQEESIRDGKKMKDFSNCLVVYHPNCTCTFSYLFQKGIA